MSERAHYCTECGHSHAELPADRLCAKCRKPALAALAPDAAAEVIPLLTGRPVGRRNLDVIVALGGLGALAVAAGIFFAAATLFAPPKRARFTTTGAMDVGAEAERRKWRDVMKDYVEDIQSLQRDLSACLTPQTENGTAVVSWTIQPDGSISEVGLDAAFLAGDTGRCFTDHIARLRFAPPPNGAAMHAVYPVVITDGEATKQALVTASYELD